MEKLRFTLLIVTLLLAFPVWFYAEMKQVDKHVEHIRNTRTDSTRVKKEQAVTDTTVSFDTEYAAMPFSKDAVINF